MLHEMKKFDANQMSLKWIKHVDGTSFFCKLPSHLKSYHKQWTRNQRVQSAVRSMKTNLEMLDALNKEQQPSELGQTGEAMGQDAGEIPMNDDETLK
jgi:hypothetical protein